MCLLWRLHRPVVPGRYAAELLADERMVEAYLGIEGSAGR